MAHVNTKKTNHKPVVPQIDTTRMTEQVDCLTATLSDVSGKEYELFLNDEELFAALQKTEEENPEQEYSANSISELYSKISRSLCLKIQQAAIPTT